MNVIAETEAIQEQIKVVEQFQNTVEGKLTTAFSNFFDFTKKEFLDFGNLSKKILSEVINELIRTFLIKRLVSGIMTGISGLGSGGGLGGGAFKQCTIRYGNGRRWFYRLWLKNRRY